MAYCPSCGAPTTGGPTCASCGASLSEAPRPMAPPPGAPAAPYDPATGYATGTGPAPPGARPTGVTVVAVLCFVLAGFMLLAGFVVAFFMEALFASMGPAMPADFEIPPGLGVAIFLFVAIFAGLVAWVGWGVLNGRNWARIAAIVLAVLYGLSALGDIVNSPVSAIVSLAIAGWVVYYLLQPEARNWFAAMGAQRATWR